MRGGSRAQPDDVLLSTAALCNRGLQQESSCCNRGARSRLITGARVHVCRVQVEPDGGYYRQDVAHLLRMFKTGDADGDGMLSKDEVRALLKGAGGMVS